MRVCEWESDNPEGVKITLWVKPALEKNESGGLEIRHLYSLEHEEPHKNGGTAMGMVPAEDLDAEKIEEAMRVGRCPALEAFMTRKHAAERLEEIGLMWPMLKAAISNLNLSAAARPARPSQGKGSRGL